MAKSYNIADVKIGDAIDGLGVVEEIYNNGEKNLQFKINGNYYHERVVIGTLDNIYKKKEVTPRKLQGIISKFTNEDDVKSAANNQLIEAKKLIDTYVEKLGDGLSSVNEEFKFLYDQGFFRKSDRGFIPQNVYLNTNLQYSREKIDQELQRTRADPDQASQPPQNEDKPMTTETITVEYILSLATQLSLAEQAELVSLIMDNVANSLEEE